MKTRIIGLTGGIGTGKSTVANYLAQQYDVPILDADIYAREGVEPGSDILTEISQRYGDQILREDGSLDRTKLGTIVFQDPIEKQWLESLLHPYVRARLVEELAKLNSTVVVLVIPLLIEAQMLDLVTEVWVVGCESTEQLKRVKQRDQWRTEEALRRIESQLPLAKKYLYADVILDNSGRITDLYEQIDQVMRSSQTRT